MAKGSLHLSRHTATTEWKPITNLRFFVYLKTLFSKRIRKSLLPPWSLLMCQGYGVFSAAKRMCTEYFSLKVKWSKLPYATDLLHSLGVLFSCNGIKVPSSQNPFSLSLLDEKMSKSCLELNSKVIRDKAECHIILAIEKKCSVVAFKCVWRVHDDEIER